MVTPAETPPDNLPNKSPAQHDRNMMDGKSAGQGWRTAASDSHWKAFWPPHTVFGPHMQIGSELMQKVDGAPLGQAACPRVVTELPDMTLADVSGQSKIRRPCRPEHLQILASSHWPFLWMQQFTTSTTQAAEPADQDHKTVGRVNHIWICCVVGVHWLRCSALGQRLGSGVGRTAYAAQAGEGCDTGVAACVVTSRVAGVVLGVGGWTHCSHTERIVTAMAACTA